MITGFAHKDLEDFFYEGSKRGIQSRHAQRLADILDRLDAAQHVEDMRYPGSGLHPLQGTFAGYWAVRVSGNWRVIFRFDNGNAFAVNYLDYHEEEAHSMRERTRPPTHPGGILKRHYLEQLHIGIAQAALALGVSRQSLSKIVHEQRAVTPEMALRLGKAFHTTPELWLNLQRTYDLWHAAHQSEDWRHVQDLVAAE